MNVSTLTVSLSDVVRRPVIDRDGCRIGTLADVLIRLRQDDYPIVSGLVVAVGTLRSVVPAGFLAAMGPGQVRLRCSTSQSGTFARREGEVLLRDDVLDHRLIDLVRVAFVKAYDVQLTQMVDGWAVTGLDVHRRRWLGLGIRHAAHPPRDWRDFEPLIGHAESARVRRARGRIPVLKPAQIADIIEEANDDEQGELLAQVHANPELEADVFAELDEDSQSELFRDRSDAEVAEVLSRMQVDDAADAIMDLPRERRSPVLDQLPEPQRTDVHRLLGYHDLTAGGLMGTDFVAVQDSLTVADAIEAVRAGAEVGMQPQALVTVYALRADGTLSGCLSLVRAVQADPRQQISELEGTGVVAASAGDDIARVTRRMSDFNLLALPVVDDEDRIIGLVTVDDALEAAIPEDWSRREMRHRETGSES